MHIVKEMNLRVRKLSLLDMKLAQGCAIFLTLIIVKIAPQVININIWWFIGLLIVCAVKPVYVFFLRK